MPKISAESIGQHVAQQRAAVLEAATRLFITQGYGEVTLADIAAEVGLARSSLYRYVPDKFHLLVDWYRLEVPQIIDDWQRALDGDEPVPTRLKKWATSYLEWAARPEHALVGPLTDGLAALDNTTRDEVRALHDSMMKVVADTLKQSGIQQEMVDPIVGLLTGLVLGAARVEAVDKRGNPALRVAMNAAIEALVGSYS